VRIAETVNHPFQSHHGVSLSRASLPRKRDLDKAICFLERCRELGQAWNIPIIKFGVASYLGLCYVSYPGASPTACPLFERNDRAVHPRWNMGRPVPFQLSTCVRGIGWPTE